MMYPALRFSHSNESDFNLEGIGVKMEAKSRNMIMIAAFQVT